MRILVPTDFSRYAQRAANRAMRLGSSRSCRIHLVHVLPTGSHAAPARAEAARALEEERVRLERTIARDEIPRVSVTATLLSGEPYVEIIRQAREIDAEIVVLGSKGAGIALRKVLGRTAARVARMADIPVLLVRARAEAPYRRPLVALPQDPSARRLLKLVRTIANPSITRLDVVRAYDVPLAGFIDPGTEKLPTRHHQEFKAIAAAELRAQIQALARRGFPVRPRLRWGDARGVILLEADRMNADLIALGTHGRSGLAHAIVGSVAEWVLLNAKVDVLVARPVRFTFEFP